MTGDFGGSRCPSAALLAAPLLPSWLLPQADQTLPAQAVRLVVSGSAAFQPNRRKQLSLMDKKTSLQHRNKHMTFSGDINTTLICVIEQPIAIAFDDVRFQGETFSMLFHFLRLSWGTPPQMPLIPEPIVAEVGSR